jgi:Na+/H+ antiporter NhaD/arsenite permease-like protein
MTESVLVTVAMVALFFLGQPIAKVAILGRSLLLFTRRVKIEKVYREIDWPLLVVFVGLFIMVGGLEKAVLTPNVIDAIGHLHLESVALLSAVTAGYRICSATFRPFSS